MAPRRAAATATSHECRSRRRARDTRSTLSNSAEVFRPPTTLAAGLQQPQEKGNDDKESRPAPRAGRPRAASTHCARPRVGVWSWLGRLPDGAGRRGSASPGRGGSRRHPKARGHSRGRRAPTFPPPPPLCTGDTRPFGARAAARAVGGGTGAGHARHPRGGGRWGVRQCRHGVAGEPPVLAARPANDDARWRARRGRDGGGCRPVGAARAAAAAARGGAAAVCLPSPPRPPRRRR